MNATTAAQRRPAGLPPRRPPPPLPEADYDAPNPWAAAFALAPHGFHMFPVWGMRSSYHPSGTKFVCECVGGADRTCRKNQPGKHPRQFGWQRAATCDGAMLATFARAYPRANVGLRTGRASRLVVIDIDGEAGVESLARLERALGPLPATVRSRSGREGPGFHLWFRLDPEGPIPRNSASTLGSGIDVRGEGGYVVSVGSMHKSGRRYAWECSPAEVDFAYLPPAWLEAMPTVDGEVPTKPTPRGPKRQPQERPANTKGSSLLGDGDGRGGFNAPLYRLACRYFAADPGAPIEPLLISQRGLIDRAPKAPGRDVSRYLSNEYLTEQAENARQFILRKNMEKARA